MKRETQKPETRLLVVVDELSRQNGAGVATLLMIPALRARGFSVDLLCGRRTDDLAELDGVRQFELPEPRHGIRYLVQGVFRRLKLAPAPNWTFDPDGAVRRLMRTYDTVLVVGENTHYRHLVASVPGPCKVVFIHTDYVTWKSACGWAIEDSRYDRQIYRGFDVIAVVGQSNADRFAAYYPEFKEKVCAFHNLFPPPVAAPSAAAATDGRLRVHSPVRIVTLSRLEFFPQKKTDRLVRVAAALKRRGCAFDWTVYGAGSAADEAALRELVREEGVADVFRFAGFTDRPADALADADLHVLLSAYEGSPNVVYEALAHGVPCVATDVGTIREMVDDGRTGLVVPQDENEIADRMEAVLKRPETIAGWKRNLVGYAYDNEKVLREYERILRGRLLRERVTG